MFGALVDARGRFVWCCMDTFDGDPVFNCLVNNNSDKTGFYDVVLEDFDRAEQTYEVASTVLITALHTSKGDVVEIRDFAPRFVHYDRVFRPFQLIRTVKRMKGDPRVSIRIRPTFQYNSTDGYQTRGSQHVRFCGPNNTWRVTTNMPIRRVLEEMKFLVSDEPVIIIFGSDESFTNSLSQVAAEFETKTTNYWKNWCNSLFLPVEFQEVLMRSAMTLAMLQAEDSGGFLAALSMGVPLGPFCPSSCDSRVCRLLDECLALPVMREVGLLECCRKFLNFAKEICYREEAPQHSYNSWGSSQEKKREWAPYLAGYRGMGEVHSGGPFLEDIISNLDSEVSGASDAWNQHTVIYGLLAITLVHAFFDVRLSQELCTPKLCEKLESYAQQACDAFTQRSQLYKAFGASVGNEGSGSKASGTQPPMPCGAGFFDDNPQFFRREEQNKQNGTLPVSGQHLTSMHTLTSVLCWAAADRLHRVAVHFFRDPVRAEHWQKKALEIHEEICKHAWSPGRGAFTTFWGGDRVGSSVLRLAELGFLSAEDGRFRGTLRAFEFDAGFSAVCLGSIDHEPHPEDASAMLTVQSVCFTTNTLLWYCEALRSTGAPNEARRLLEAILKSSKHQGLLAEAIDLRSGEQWGNSPSAPALLSLLRVAPRLSRTWREV